MFEDFINLGICLMKVKDKYNVKFRIWSCEEFDIVFPLTFYLDLSSFF
jgi:hypothetical protein